MRSRVVSTALLAVLAITTFLVPPGQARATQDPFCGDVQLIWARGTATSTDAFDFTRANADLQARLGAGISYSSYQLGKDGGYGGHAYPASGNTWELFLHWSPLDSQTYENSVAEGRAELVAYINHRAGECGGEVYVLGGWSQGAEVIGESLPLLDQTIRDRVAYVALFGDPTYASNNIELVSFTNWCLFDKEPWVRGTAECFSAGVFGPRFDYVPSDIEGRVGSWCRDGDGSCTGILNDILLSTAPPDGQHFQYFQTNGDASMAMREAVDSLKSFLPDQANDLDASFLQFATGSAGADLVFVFDTTGSMYEEIADAKAQATNLANLWLAISTRGRVALVEFRDQGDAFVSRVDLPFTNDPAAFQTAVNALQADGGGDTPEAQLSGIMTALDGLDWQPGATKVGIVVTDAVGKDPEPVTGYTRSQVSQHSLEIDPVAIYGADVANDPAVSGFIASMATATGGRVASLAPGQTLSDLLADVMQTVAMSPVASLGGPYYAQPGTAVHFRADSSFDPDGAITNFEWDFNGDGIVDQTTTTGRVDHTYAGTYSGTATVRVVATDGGRAVASTQVTVGADPFAGLLPVAPSAAAAQVTGEGQVTVTWTPAPADRAGGYTITQSNTHIVRSVPAGTNSTVISGIDLNQSAAFEVRAANDFGYSSPIMAQAATTMWSSPSRVNDDTTTTQQVYPDVALAPDGGAIAVWQDGRAAPGGDVYASRWNPTTLTWGANVRVNDTATGDQYRPSVQVDASGNAYAIWVDTRNGRTDIYFSKRSAATGMWSSNVRVNTTTKFGIQDWPALAIAPDGSAIAVWYRTTSGKLELWSARLAAGGSTWGPEIRVTSNTSAQKQSPAVALGPDGAAHVVWMQPASGDADIWYASLPSGSSTWAASQKVSDDPGTAMQSSPAVGVDGAGKVFVVWTDRRSSPYQLRVRTKPASGTWQPSTVISADGGNSPSIAVRSDGRAYVAWHDGDFYTEYPRLWGAAYDPGAGTWGQPERIDASDATHGARNPSVALTTANLVVVWDSALSLPSGDNNDDIIARMCVP